MRTAATDAGEVAWVTGDSVRLVGSRDLQKTDYPAPLRFEMRRASDDALLVAASQDDDEGAQEGFAPIGVAIDSPCGLEDGLVGEPGLSLRVTLSGPAGESLWLFDRQHDVLTLEDASFAVDVAPATTNNCCHGLRYLSLLIQRVL